MKRLSLRVTSSPHHPVSRTAAGPSPSHRPRSPPLIQPSPHVPRQLLPLPLPSAHRLPASLRSSTRSWGNRSSWWRKLCQIWLPRISKAQICRCLRVGRTIHQGTQKWGMKCCLWSECWWCGCCPSGPTRQPGATIQRGRITRRGGVLGVDCRGSLLATRWLSRLLCWFRFGLLKMEWESVLVPLSLRIPTSPLLFPSLHSPLLYLHSALLYLSFSTPSY